MQIKLNKFKNKLYVFILFTTLFKIFSTSFLYAGSFEVKNTQISKQFDINFTAEQLAEKYPEQWSAIFALQKSYDEGKSTGGVIVQNKIDLRHYDRHYLPFCKYFKLQVEGGLNKKYGLYSMLFSHEQGHGPETSEVAKLIVKDYLPMLLA